MTPQEAETVWTQLHEECLQLLARPAAVDAADWADSLIGLEDHLQRLPKADAIAPVPDAIQATRLHELATAVAAAHERLRMQLRERMAQLRTAAVEDHRRGGALRAYAADRPVPAARYHDRRG